MLEFARLHLKAWGWSREFSSLPRRERVFCLSFLGLMLRLGSEQKMFCTRSAEACFTFGNNAYKNSMASYDNTLEQLVPRSQLPHEVRREHQGGVIARYLPRVPKSKLIYGSWVSKKI